MSNDNIDLYEYGKLVATVEALEKKIDKLEHNMEQLLTLANKSRGGFWVGIIFVSAISSVFGYFASHFVK